MQPIVKAIYISPDHNYFGHYGQAAGEAPVVSVETADLVAGQGIVGDRFYGFKENYKGQVTFFSEEVYHDLCRQFQIQDRGPEVFRRNILVAGVDLNSFIGQEFEIQGVKFLGMAECSPCAWMDEAFGPGAEQALHGRGGLRAKVLTNGSVKKSVE
jgi:MOSC domain-containing protein YiiM